VLLSAYACEPNLGSEPEVGWQWGLQMARFHEVTVLTRASNRKRIEAGLGSRPRGLPTPRFVYHDRADWLLKARRRLRLNAWVYYLLWQRSARREVAVLHAENHFDLLHHLTWTEFRSRPAVLGHPVPVIWGPVNGSEVTPWELMPRPLEYPGAFLHELSRSLSGRLSLWGLRRKAAAAATVLVSARETQEAFRRLGCRTCLFPETGVHWREYVPRSPRTGPLRLLFDGRLTFYKGVHLALQALKASGTDAVFTIVGNGEFRSAMERLAHQLGLNTAVRFENRLAYAEMLKRQATFDVFLFPSLHDSGGIAVLEAMLGGLPVICLDCGGPALAVGEQCGFKIPTGRPGSVVAGLAQAIRAYDRDRSLMAVHGRNAWAYALEHYLWDTKAERLNAIYQAAASRGAAPG
jgi:glycosyltransferase involved in cell wall biosynthesis